MKKEKNITKTNLKKAKAYQCLVKTFDIGQSGCEIEADEAPSCDVDPL